MKKLMSIAVALVLSAGVLSAEAMPLQKDSTKAKTHKMHKAHKGAKAAKKDSTKS